MKKLFYALFLIMIATACSSEQEPSQTRTVNTERNPQLLYEEYTTDIQIQFAKNWIEINKNDDNGEKNETSYPETMTGYEYIKRLCAISENDLTVISDRIKANFNQDSFDQKYAFQLEKLISETSESDVEALFSFTEVYLDKGGNSQSLLTTYTNNRPIIIQNMMIYMAAYIDQINIPETRSVSGGARYCLDILIHDMASDAIKDLIAGTILGLAGPLGEIVDTGAGFIGTLNDALKFNRCMATHA